MSNDNTSGHGAYAFLPVEATGWNWGAFWLTWIWGIGNRSYIALLALVPIVNIFIPFYLGAKGNELAWKNQPWTGTDRFMEVQKTWAIAGWVFAAIIIVCIGIQFHYLNKTDQLAKSIQMQVMEEISNNPEAQALIGTSYTMSTDPTLQYLMNAYGDYPSIHTFLISTDSRSIFVNTRLDGEYTLQEITLIPDTGASIVIKPD